MRRRLRAGQALGALATGLIFCGAVASHAVPVVLDFQSLEAGGSTNTAIDLPSLYQEDGYDINATGATGDLGVWRTGSDHYPGSTALFSQDDGGTLTLTRTDSGTFSLFSMEISEVFDGLGQSVSVSFLGTRSDTSTVTQTFNLDGNFGLETFVFTGFTDLVSVTWDQVVDYHQFDNVVLTPEPSTLALLAAGVLGLTVYGRPRL